MPSREEVIRRLAEEARGLGLEVAPYRIVERDPMYGEGFLVQWEAAGDGNFLGLFAHGWASNLEELLQQELEVLRRKHMTSIYSTGLYPYIQGDMLKDLGDVTFTIAGYSLEEMPAGADGRPAEILPVIWFEERDKGLILNKTNAQTIVKNVGTDEMDDWVGRKITLFAKRGKWFGEYGWAVRIRQEESTPVDEIEEKGADEEE